MNPMDEIGIENAFSEEKMRQFVDRDGLKDSNEEVMKAIDELYVLLKGVPRLSDNQLAFRARRRLAKLVLDYRRLPQTVVLQNVRRATDDHGQLGDAVFSGGFGDIYQGQLGERLVSIKRLRPQNGDVERHERSFLKEILVLCDIEHSSIMEFLGVSYTIDGFRNSVCIIVAWYANGTVEQVLGAQPEFQSRLPRWIFELVDGIKYLHTRQVPVIHGDLKAANLLIDDEWHVRIADFGLSRNFQVTNTMTGTVGNGSLPWSAPELFAFADDMEEDEEGVEHQTFKKSKESDIWAFGCTLYEMYAGQIPYHHLHKGRPGREYQVMKALQSHEKPGIARPEQPDSRTTMPGELWEGVVLGCWAADPHDRLNIESISEHSFFWPFLPLDSADEHLMLDLGRLLHSIGFFGHNPLPERLQFTLNGRYLAAVYKPTTKFYNESSKALGAVLMEATRRGNLEMVKFLIGKIPFDVKDEGGRTAFYYATFNNHWEIAACLANRGADLQSTDNEGQTPLMRAAQLGKLEIVTFLIEKSVPLNARDQDGHTAVFYATLNNHLEVLQCLVDHGANLRIPNRDGKTPLMIAAYWGSLKMVKFLTGKSVPLNTRNNRGRTAIFYAAMDNRLEVVKWLAERGANLRISDDDGYSPLMISTSCGHVEIVRFLIGISVPLAAQDNYGRTALDHAANGNHQAIYTLLVDHGAMRGSSR